MFETRRQHEHLIGGIKVQELDFILQICLRWYCWEGEAAYEHKIPPNSQQGLGSQHSMHVHQKARYNLEGAHGSHWSVCRDE